MIDLSNTKPFASGGNRDCYINPSNANTCIKVTKKKILEKIKKDFRIHDSLKNYIKIWPDSL